MFPPSTSAGQHETYLGVNEKNLIVMVRACWKSLFSCRVLQYRAALGILDAPLGMAVGVQEMINPVKSGVMFTANPVTKNVDEVVIEASWG